MLEKTKQFTALVESGIYDKIKTISNNTNFYSTQSVLNSILKASLNTKEGMTLMIEADDGERYSLQDWIERGEEEVTLDDFSEHTKNSRSISKQFKESFNALPIKEKNSLKKFVRNIIEYMKKKGFTPEIGTNINASIHAININNPESYEGSHVLYIKIERNKIFISGLMHFNRKSFQIRSEEYPEDTDFVWKEIMSCINSNISCFEPYIEEEVYIVDNESLEILVNYFNNL